MSLDKDADDWFMRMRRPDAADFRAKFEEWRSVSAHAQAYERRVRSFDTMMFLASTRTVRNRNLDIAKPWVLRTALRKFAAAAISLMLTGALLLIVAQRSFGGPQSLSRIEIASLEEVPRHVSLPDGSKLLLDRGSRVQISYDHKQRRLRLLVGRARFSVAHEEARPFIVEAGTGRVIAHGTLFDVELAQSTVRIALLQGAVEVREASRGNGRKRLELVAGERTAIEGGMVAKPTLIEAPESQWPNDMLVLDSVDIGEAVSAFNRTAPTPVLFELRSAQPMKVSGAFRRSDPEGFARQLAATFGLRVETHEDGSFVIMDDS